MLTRLKVSGFKNLIDVDIPLGPLYLCCRCEWHGQIEPGLMQYNFSVL